MRRVPRLLLPRKAGLARASGAALPSWAWNTPPTQITKLANGMTVASQHTFDETVTAGVWIDAGSRYECPASNGAAHFLEHMAFKGTKRRTRIALEKEIENMGGHLNAYTSREHTVYYAKGFKRDMRQLVDILGDILQNSSMDRQLLEIERGVILREMEEVEKQTEEVIFDRLHAAAFREAPLGYTILGPVGNINTLTRDQLLEYIRTHYSADRMVFVACGDVDHEELVTLVEQTFGQLQTSDLMSELLAKKPHFCGTELLTQTDELGDKCHLAVAYEATEWTSPDAIEFMLLQTMVGNYVRDQNVIPGELSQNRIVQRLHSSPQFANATEQFTSYNASYHDTGLFGWYAVCEPAAVAHCARSMLEGGKSFATDPISEAELERAKQHLKIAVLGQLDGTTAIAEDLGRQLLVYKRHMRAPEFLLRLAAVDVDSVQRCAQKHFHDAQIAVTAMGQVQHLPPYAELQAMTK